VFLFYAVHYPYPEKEELLIQRMYEFGELIKKQLGVLFVNTFRDSENGTLIPSRSGNPRKLSRRPGLFW